MTYQTTMTSKGQVTIPADIRKKLGLKPGQSIQFEFRGNEAIVKAQTWQADLEKIQRKMQIHLKKQGIKPLSSKKLDEAINKAAEAAATERYLKSL
ncbi:MAG: AbrB/MazE/SpoVT family DNA-binding domain-containing protein [Candidatus Saccharimonadales bacterium]